MICQPVRSELWRPHGKLSLRIPSKVVEVKNLYHDPRRHRLFAHLGNSALHRDKYVMFHREQLHSETDLSTSLRIKPHIRAGLAPAYWLELNLQSTPTLQRTIGRFKFKINRVRPAWEPSLGKRRKDGLKLCGNGSPPIPAAENATGVRMDFVGPPVFVGGLRA